MVGLYGIRFSFFLIELTGDASLPSGDDLYAAPEPMSEEERLEMMNVLQKDALEETLKRRICFVLLGPKG